MTEISSALNQEGQNGIKFLPNYRDIFHLLFADDIFLVSESIDGLQHQINILHSQSQRLGLEININKTQVVVFRKGGRIAKKDDHDAYTRNDDITLISNAMPLYVG